MLLCALLLAVFVQAREVGGINYLFNTDDYTATVVRRDYSAYAGTVTIPSKVTYGRKSYEVVAIAEGAFANCDRLTSVKIPNTVTVIGNYAFTNCTELTSVSMLNGVTAIGDEAFSYCSSLKEISIPNSVQRIMYNAFYETPLYTNKDNWIDNALYIDNCLMTVKKGVKGSFRVKQGTRIIADAAFAYVDKLSSIKIPGSILNIGAMSCIAYGLPDDTKANFGNRKLWSFYRYPFECTPDSIVIETTIPPFIDEVQATFPPSTRIFVPERAIETYKSIEQWKIYNIQAIDLKKLRLKLNLDIKKNRDEYNEKLKKNPYYDGSRINVDPIPDSQEDIAKMYNIHDRTLEAMDELYIKLDRGGMVRKMQRNNPDKYIEIYRSLHPRISAKIDSALLEYRCQPELTRKICLRIIAKKPLNPGVCRTAQYKAFGALFESKEHFDKRYNLAQTDEEFMNEVKVRKQAQKTLEELEKLLQEHGKTLDLSGTINKKDNSTAGKVNKYEKLLKESFYYDKGIALIFKYCPLFVEEFKINKIYFVSREEFYEVYISKDYNKFLKQRKKV